MFDHKLAFCKAVCCYYNKFLKLELANKRILLIVMPHQVRNSFSVYCILAPDVSEEGVKLP